ncbi:enoyl-CoA hydratase/isomerase family protein, partial [Rhodococcus fascians]|nr:enoyl-CoA hydratase/isomerase family protein [Rhodococcus fascians]MBY3999947.1 enoyl-CoA hydratase/isomerase family protein [Rhodococcus fascians]MBY4005130.1 enoyl-CoA hydratase/isomerase family protein [Rhodococcus fascians]MBY4010311.1 enoyl-CoA hydratase/isomerase family protein [Rhodococcus fascians]MBY4020354.1 enoyl-CoA hydratase/isomerase family protein [Rhodococcus fascians]
MPYETLTWSVADDGIATLTLNRPKALNAFNINMARELVQVFRTEAYDDAVRAVVVTGAGKALCAGMDLSAAGSVFGLDETLTPTPAESGTRYDTEPFRTGIRDLGGRVALAIHALSTPRLQTGRRASRPFRKSGPPTSPGELGICLKFSPIWLCLRGR